MSTSATDSSTRSRVLDVAASLFVESGDAKVPMTRVAREVGMTSQALYRYFRNVDDLQCAAVNHDYQRFIEQVLDDVSGDAWPLLSGRFWHSFERRAFDYPLVRRLLGANDDRAIATATGPLSDGIFDLFRGELERGQRRGLIRTDIDVDTVGRSLHSTAMRTLMPLAMRGQVNSPEWMNLSSGIIAAIFHPYPDLSTPEKMEQFGAQFTS